MLQGVGIELVVRVLRAAEFALRFLAERLQLVEPRREAIAQVCIGEEARQRVAFLRILRLVEHLQAQRLRYQAASWPEAARRNEVPVAIEQRADNAQTAVAPTPGAIASRDFLGRDHARLPIGR